ncbi:MAG: head decoration protein [Micrococcales bacterium]|nr:head decoration protein [Micrococcales bacterium]
MPRLTTETFGGGDQSWLGSTHGVADARTEVLDVSTLTPTTHYPDGYVPSGTPVAKVAGRLVPYDPDDGTTDGAGVLAGFVLTDQKVVGDGDLAVPVLDHGRVVVANLPVPFAVPEAADKRAAVTVVFV